MLEVPRVYFLGVCPGFHFLCCARDALVVVLNFDRGAVVKGLVEPGVVPPGDPFEGSDLDLKNVFPSMVIDQLVLIRRVSDCLCKWSI